MKNKAQLTLTIVFFMSSIILMAQSELPKCDYERYSNAKLSEDIYKEFNEALDNACKEINKGNYTKAINFLELAYQKKEVVFVEEQIHSLREYIEASTPTPQQGTNISQPDSPVTSTTPDSEPKTKPTENIVANDIKTSSNPAHSTPSDTRVAKTTELDIEQSNKLSEIATPPLTSKTTSSTESPTHNSDVESKDIQVNGVTANRVMQENTGQLQLNDSDESELKTFTKEQKKDLQEKGMAKVKQFEQYINTISNKLTSPEIASQTTENALKLFYDPNDNYVEVSSKNRPGKRRLKVPLYLERLRLLNYDNVIIEWADLNYASEFVLAQDNTYRAYIISRQRFVAMKDNVVTYEDEVTKRTEIVITQYKKSIDGIMTDNYDVFLGDISLEHTE